MGLTLRSIEEARNRIRDLVYATPLMETSYISSMTGCHVRLKPENLQKTGSFKIRGAGNKIALLSAAEKETGVITASAGNHAQGVAFAAERAGIKATVVMPRTTSLAKVEAVRRYRADVLLRGETYDEAAAHAEKIREETGATFVHAFDDFDVMAGQGVIGLEILEEWPDVDTLVVPIGGGGLISGVATAVKKNRPQAKLVGVQAASMPSVDLALGHKEPPPAGAVNTLADGIAVKQVGKLTLPIIRGLVDEIVTVDEYEIAAAVLILLERSKVVVEGSGSAPLAALMYRKNIVKGNNVVLLLSGGNIDVNMLGKIIDSGLAKSGRFMTIEVILEDVPGSLHSVLGHVARLEANVLTIEHNRTSEKAPFGKAFVTLYLETRGHEHVRMIARELAKHYEIQLRS